MNALFVRSRILRSLCYMQMRRSPASDLRGLNSFRVQVLQPDKLGGNNQPGSKEAYEANMVFTILSFCSTLMSGLEHLEARKSRTERLRAYGAAGLEPRIHAVTLVTHFVVFSPREIFIWHPTQGCLPLLHRSLQPSGCRVPENRLEENMRIF